MSAVQKWKDKQSTPVTAYGDDAPEEEHVKPTIVDALTEQIKEAQAEGRAARAARAPNEVQEIIDAVYARFNPTHFVAPFGSNVYVWVKSYDQVLGRTTYQRLTVPAFVELYRSETVAMPNGKGGYKPVPISKVWNEAPGRRCYPSGTGCYPNGDTPEGKFNTFLGWGVEAIAGDVKPILEFLLNVICSGNKEHLKYLIGWLAFCIQHPTTPPGVAVVLVGSKGTGKSTLGELFVKLHGSHGMTVSDPKFLTGSFNAHMKDLMGLFCDESLWAGDKSVEGILKARLTGKTITIESKGVDAVIAPNMMSIMMATNNEHAVPSSSDERRWFVLRVSDARQGDFDYWDKLNDYIENGGGAKAFLHYLKNFNISKFNVRSVPQTKELASQKTYSFGSLDAFLFDALTDGNLGERIWDSDQGMEMERGKFADAVIEYCQKHPKQRYNIPTRKYIGTHLTKMIGAIRSQRTHGVREKTYKLPGLKHAWEQFAKWAGLGDCYQWEE